MKLNTLKDLYIEELKDVYDAEKEIVKALPKMAKSASSPELRNAFEDHLEQTRTHVQRLEEIFAGMGEQPKTKKCHGLRGIVDEGEDLMGEDGNPSVIDAGLIAGAQRVEHYEIAVYGSLNTWAREFGDERAAQLLRTTLEEEKQTDEKLTNIAESAVNVQAESEVTARY